MDSYIRAVLLIYGIKQSSMEMYLALVLFSEYMKAVTLQWHIDLCWGEFIFEWR